MIVLLIIFIFIFYHNPFFSNSKIHSSNNVVELSKMAKENMETEVFSWSLSIPKIGLSQIKISEGTNEETLAQFIGHFNETALFNGNVGLAAHNRGSIKNYFQDLNLLEKGDLLYYTYQTETRTYEVEEKIIISVYDWSYIKRKDSVNLLTLITCVENNPNERLCIVAKERGKE